MFSKQITKPTKHQIQNKNTDTIFTYEYNYKIFFFKSAVWATVAKFQATIIK